MMYVVVMSSGGLIYICTKFHDDRFSHLSNITVQYFCTVTQHVIFGCNTIMSQSVYYIK
jgi:hypothetical protein